MKKSLVAFGAVALATAAFAADGLSSNMVGFDKVATKPNTFIQLAAQFQDVTTGKLAFEKIFTGLKGVDYDDDNVWLMTAPQVQFFDGSDYNIYYYLNDGFVVEDRKIVGRKAGWCDVDGIYTDLTATPGQGFWFKNPSMDAAEICGAGQVEQATEASVEAPAGIFSILANIFPMTINLNDEKHVMADGIVGVDYDDDNVWLSTAPQVQFFNGTDYDIYYYLNDGYVVESGKIVGRKAGWCNVDGIYVDVIIPSQQSFWVKANTGKFTFAFKR